MEYNWKPCKGNLKIDWNEMKNHEPFEGFFWDDGTLINPKLIHKPSFYILCQKDDKPSEEILCILTRAD